MSAVLDVNVVGIVRVTHAFLPLLSKSPNMTQDPARIESQYALPLYCAPKTAVTMLKSGCGKGFPNRCTLSP